MAARARYKVTVCHRDTLEERYYIVRAASRVVAGIVARKKAGVDAGDDNALITWKVLTVEELRQ